MSDTLDFRFSLESFTREQAVAYGELFSKLGNILIHSAPQGNGDVTIRALKTGRHQWSVTWTVTDKRTIEIPMEEVNRAL